MDLDKQKDAREAGRKEALDKQGEGRLRTDRGLGATRREVLERQRI